MYVCIYTFGKNLQDKVNRVISLLLFYTAIQACSYDTFSEVFASV